MFLFVFVWNTCHKNNMTMATLPFEEVFPIEKWWFSNAILVNSGVYVIICDLPPFNSQNLSLYLYRGPHFFSAWKSKSKVRAFPLKKIPPTVRFHQRKISSKEQTLGGGFKHSIFSSRNLGKIPISTNIFQLGWTHQVENTRQFFIWLDIIFFGIMKWPDHSNPSGILTGCQTISYQKTLFCSFRK